jgi:hypothetical protein
MTNSKVYWLDGSCHYIKSKKKEGWIQIKTADIQASISYQDKIITTTDSWKIHDISKSWLKPQWIPILPIALHNYLKLPFLKLISMFRECFERISMEYVYKYLVWIAIAGCRAAPFPRRSWLVENFRKLLRTIDALHFGQLGDQVDAAQKYDIYLDGNIFLRTLVGKVSRKKRHIKLDSINWIFKKKCLVQCRPKDAKCTS